MKLSEYAAHDALGLAEIIGRGEVSKKEVATAAARAIEALNPTLNAVLELFEDRVAAQSDTPTPRAANAGVFDGVPMMLKDIGASEKGRKQEAASPLLRGRIVGSTSYLTQRFFDAGLVNIGRTALPELGLASANSVSRLHGTTVNPWDADYMAGASSGGAGAAVASAMIPIGHASDIGGSTRHPAAICGAVGLKTSRGRISLGPDRFDFPHGTLNEFAITRTVRDSAALLDAVEGPGRGEARTVPELVRPLLQETEAGRAGTPIREDGAPLRVAVNTASWCAVGMDPEIAAAVGKVGKVLEDMGAATTEARPEFDFDELAQADYTVVSAVGATSLAKLAAESGADLEKESFSPIIADMIKAMRTTGAADLFAAFEAYNRIRRSIGLFFEDTDLLVLPCISSQTDPWKMHELEVSDMVSDKWMHHYQFFVPFNISGNPAISLPLCMSSSGMPIGIQLVAGFAQEALLFRASAALEEAMPWKDRIPKHHASRI